MLSAHNARRILSTLALGGSILLVPAAASAQTLEKIKARGNVTCGVNPSLLGILHARRARKLERLRR